MKKRGLIIIFIICISFLKAQSVYQKNISFHYHNTSLHTFINELKEKHQLKFSYSSIDLTQKFTINFNGKLSHGMRKVFQKLGLNYKRIGDQIVIKKANLVNVYGNILGRVINSDTKQPILGASIVVMNYESFLGTTSDIDGYFNLDKIPLGRYDLKISYISFQTEVINQLPLNSAKDLYLDIELMPSTEKVKEVLIIRKPNNLLATNEMTATSLRKFTVEETERYAVSISDPARMAQNYAGVTSGNDDSTNDLVIRGNSPRGLLWKLEGVEIPNPNHFGDLGSRGGVLSFLSSTTLNNSDFYTSSFPAQFGNSLSGVFDLKLKKGNSSKNEHSFKLSLLGVEGATEGYFSKKSKASYLAKYRISSAFLLKNLSSDILETNVVFQDATFKIHVPTKEFGTISFFGLGGLNTNQLFQKNEEDIKKGLNFKDEQRTGVSGISNFKIFSEQTQLKSSVAVSHFAQKWSIDNIDSSSTLPPKRVLMADFSDISIIASTTINHNFSSKHLLKSGLIYTHKFYDYFLLINNNQVDNIFFDNKNNTSFFQQFAQWQFRISDKMISNLGYHFSFLNLNGSFAFDPRYSLSYKVNNKHSLSVSTGIFSKPEHISTYLIENNRSQVQNLPNYELNMTSSIHNVFAYNFNFAKDFRLKLELYYQYLYNVPVREDEDSDYSSLNAENVFDILTDNSALGQKLVSKGSGQNYGVDITIEKFFSKKYYGLFTASLFDSYYTTAAGRQFRTAYANNYMMTLLGGKEFNVGKNKNNRLSLNGKFLLKGGQRYTPIDLAESIKQNEEVYFERSSFSEQFEPYYRFDLGLQYKLNTKKTTHTFSVDVQNVTNHRNKSEINYNKVKQIIETEYQFGLLPFISYQLDFSFDKK